MMKKIFLKLLVILSVRCAMAEDIVIQSFDSAGRLTFNTTSNATGYRIEWAPAPEGPWSTFTAAGQGPYAGFAAATGGLDSIPPPTNGAASVTVTVPMCYRVVLGDPLYMVVDLSEGPMATNYPVSFLMSVPEGGWTDEYKSTRMVLRYIAAGTFIMGTPTNQANEIQHQVTLSRPFYIGVYEVTQRQWERVMGDWPGYFTNAACRDTRPVEQVAYSVIRGAGAGTNWPATNSVDADSFMGRLRARTGKVFDLPTEAQWEYAGRAATTTPLNSGKELTDEAVAEVGRYYYNGGSGYTANGDTTVGSAKVGSYPANQWGLYDIHGNVYEWCLDWNGAYVAGIVSDPKGAESASNREIRGGSWNSFAGNCRISTRAGGLTGKITGFRVAVPTGR